MPDFIPTDPAATPTAFQAAIRARAQATLENGERQPKPTTLRKVLTGLAACVVVGSLVLLIDFTVGVMQRILVVWYGDPAEQSQSAPAYDPTKPFYITVNPPAEAESSANSSASDASPQSPRP